MLRAKDVMSAEVVSVTKYTPILEAARLMVDYSISGLPVVDDDGSLAGVLSEKDAVVLFYEQKEAAEKNVADYMTYPAVCFDENAPLLDVCDFLARNIFRRVPITADGKLAGIISIKDILEAVLREQERSFVQSH